MTNHPKQFGGIMKLNEIKTVNSGDYILSEGVIPVHLTMTLEQVISAGRVTNNVQHFIMAGLTNMFKDGGPARWPRDLNSYPMCSSCEILESIRALSPEESVDLARWLVEMLQNPATFESNPYACSQPSMGTAEWVRWVTRKQD
jgi:hypothetical protein